MDKTNVKYYFSLSASYWWNGCKQVITEEVHVTNQIVIPMSLFLLNKENQKSAGKNLTHEITY